MSKLDELVAAAREAVARRSAEVPASELRSQLHTRTGARPFSEALVRPGLSLICEFKRSSPSAGAIQDGAEVAEVVREYQEGGAAALSVLTEETRFGGSLADLREARAASTLPILRKDFIVDHYQLYEAAIHGADAVLLIVAALDDEQLASLYAEARELDLDCLVEVHEASEVERALELDVDVIGINNRNLGTLEVDIATTPELATMIPAGKTVVAESGYTNRDQMLELERIGVDAVLIGEALMRTGDPAGKIAELTGHAAEARERELEA